MALEHDFHIEDGCFLLSIDHIPTDPPEIDLKDIKYRDIFEEGILKKIKSDDFQEKIEAFLKNAEEICSRYSFLGMGSLTLPRFQAVQKELEKDKFFEAKNKIVLNGNISIKSTKELKEQIKEISKQMDASNEFGTLIKSLSDVKGSNLRALIEAHHEIVSYLGINQLDNLRRILWQSYFNELKEEIEDLKAEFKNLQPIIQNQTYDKSPWERALEVFNSRFSVPFKMKIDNFKSAVLGESMPRVVFTFSDEQEQKSRDISRKELEELDVLSQGERRALYLLNIVFDVEQRKLSRQKTLYIIDDIADSFDYKNKYAIVEYLADLKENPSNELIILSHNFDFYRTVASRLGLSRSNRLIACINKDNSLGLQEEKYQKHPFNAWKMNPRIPKYFLALIPFIRNLIDYGKELNVLEGELGKEDSVILTSLLHLRKLSPKIRVAHLKKLYSVYLSNDKIVNQKIGNYNDDEKVIDLIFSEAKKIAETDADLEDKIILSIAIRLYAEKFMIGKLTSDQSDYNESKKNQTRELSRQYKKKFPNELENIQLMAEVNIVTPEQIHFNSFMYEPLVDMDINELLSLYHRVRDLS